VGDRFWELSLLTSSIFPLMRLGRWDEALDAAETAQRSEELTSLELASIQLLFVVPVLVNRGETDDAKRIIEGRPPQSERPEGQAILSMARATLLLGEGDAAGALEAARSGVAVLPEIGLSSPYVKEALVKGVEAELELGDLDGAAEFLSLIERARPGQITPYLRAQGARLGARLSSLRGAAEAVEPGFLAAERGFRDVGIPFGLAVALMEHAQWLSAQDRGPQADPLLAEAREIFERLHAKPWMERLELVAARQPVLLQPSPIAQSP
jgi:ATP/maltotriose-dependent transcriptional regulator MalT